MRTFSALGVIHPVFYDRLELSAEVSDMEGLFSDDSRLSMHGVRTVPTQAVCILVKTDKDPECGEAYLLSRLAGLSQRQDQLYRRIAQGCGVYLLEIT